jgi:hypothetical protein
MDAACRPRAAELMASVSLTIDAGLVRRAETAR